MTKRFGNFDSKNNKKLKLEDDIWGDDLDEDALVNCINLATQVCEEKINSTQLNNVSILPSYDAFKKRNPVVTSTQLNNSVHPSTSKFEFSNKKMITENLQKEIKILRQQYEEKEGEVSILRTQLQETKTNIQIEQQKTQNDWKEKLSITEKQMKSVKSELEFKNLEIANLRQKILDIRKHNNMDITLNTTQNFVISKSKNKSDADSDEIKKASVTIQAVLDSVQPLKGILRGAIFNVSKREHHIIETKLTRTCRNSIPYLQNQITSAITAVDKSHVTIDSIYFEIVKLANCTESDLNSDANIVNINKVLCTCEQFLVDLQTFLDQIKSNLRTEDILEADSKYLKYQDNDCPNEDEIGQKAGILLSILAELLPYSDYLIRYICQDKRLSFQKEDSYIKNFPYLAKRDRNFKQNYFLSMLLNIIKTAAEIRKAGIMTSFFCSVIKLLTNIGRARNYDYVPDIFCKLTKKLILSRPTAKVICQITFLFKVASQNSSFIEFLFNISKNSISSKKGILYFNEDACRFYVFVMLFDNCIFKSKNESFCLSVCLNVLCFMYNTFKTSYWIHHRDIKECECVPQLYKLEIDIVFRALEKYIEDVKRNKQRDSNWNQFFKNAITVKVLNLMTFNSNELTEKYITVFSQYKEIERRLQEENDLRELENLNINEEVIEISSSAFVDVNF